MLKKFVVILLCVSIVLLIVPLPNVSAASTLAESINDITSNVNWANVDFRIQHTGVIFNKVSSPNYGLSYPDSDQSYSVWGALLSELDGFGSNGVTIAQTFPMTSTGGLPMDYNSGYMVYHRFMTKLYDWLPSRWDKSTALATMNSMVSGAGNLAIVYTPPSGYYIQNNRYYDEHAETMDFFLQFGDIAKAQTLWQWNYQSHWNGQYWGYSGTSGMECEAGNFAMLAARLYKATDETLPYFNTVIQDLSAKFTVSGWNSPLWAGSYVCTHMCDSRLRLQNTLGAWAALQMFYPLMSSTDKANMVNMLTGSTKAWQYLLSSNLYSAPKFRLMFNGEGPPATDSLDTWSMIGLKTLFLMGIIPDTASLAIPLLESAYEDTETMFPATHFRFDYNNKRIRVPVTAGTMKFQFGTTTPSASFSSSGIYEVQFSGDWNTVSSVSRVSNLNPSFYYLTETGTSPPVDYGNIRVSGTYEGTTVPFEAWIDDGQHVSVPVEGYTFGNVLVGSHQVHGLYNGVEKTEYAEVQKSATTPVSFDFSEQPPGPNWWEEFKLWLRGIMGQVDPTLLFGGLGIGVTVGVIFAGAQWSHKRDLARKPAMKRKRRK